MRSRVSLFILVYTLMNVLSTVALYLLKEQRVDVYVSLNILSYYVSYAVVRPSTLSSIVRVLNAALFALFIAIVAYRVYEVLAP
uniref:Uncharacterized protein n=1 Tax=Ignisphaera aggregans TaxID=334771 RepID=A0A7J3Z5V3_9CREN